MGALDGLLQQVTQAIVQHGEKNGYDHSGLLGQITSMFTAHPSNSGGSRQVKPASQDPYGDPGAQASHIKPASEDPDGDPADAPRQR